MAVVKGPAMSIDASGNVGPICYSRWRGLNIARAAWSGGDPSTPKQLAAQVIMKDVSQDWSDTLTGSDREAWRLAAMDQVRLSRVRTKYVPTGYQYYVQLSCQSKRLGNPILTLPPPPILAYGFEEYVGAWNEAVDYVYLWIVDPFFLAPAGFQLETWKAGPFDGGGRHPIEPEYRFLAFDVIDGTVADNNVVREKYYWYRGRWIEQYGRVGEWHPKQIYVPVAP